MTENSKGRFLLVYPNLMLVSQLPNNVAVLSACLTQAGYDVRVFDSTLYKTAVKTNDEMRVERGQVRKFNVKDVGIEIKKNDILDDFREEVLEYKPDVIGVTVVEDTYQLALQLIDRIKDLNIPNILGGVHVTLNPDLVISNSLVTVICRGEGERAIVAYADAIMAKESIDAIENLWIKKDDGTIFKNEMGSLVDLDSLPFDDFSVFDEKRIFRPMQGKMVAAIPINFDRGCPYLCTFCAAPELIGSYRKETSQRYFRRKSIDTIMAEIKYQMERFPVNYFYFNSETFLSMSKKDLHRLAEEYALIGIPFWCQTRIETIKEEDIKLLKEMNCDRVSLGIEHGNEAFRKKVLKKTFTNQQAIDAVALLNKYDLKVSVNNMIGFPDETRALAFDTIEFNRQIKVDSTNGFVFQPYGGTYLKQYSLEKGYLKEESEVDSPIGHTVLRMPQFSREEIEGIVRTFSLYVKMPKEYWPDIKIAEKDTPEGNEKLCELREILFDKYFN